MSKFLSSTFQGVGALQLPKVSIIHNLGGVLPFFSFFIINNLQRHTHGGAKALTIEGVIPLPSKSPDLRKSVNDGFYPFYPFESCSKDSAFATAATKFRTLCLLRPLDETAPEPSILKIPSSEAIQNHSTGAENGIGLSGSEDHRGRSGGRGDTVRIRYIFGKREFCEGSAQRDRSPNQ